MTGIFADKKSEGQFEGEGGCAIPESNQQSATERPHGMAVFWFRVLHGDSRESLSRLSMITQSNSAKTAECFLLAGSKA